ncbi:hypothetical protein [Paracoccus sp. SM22M-07]|uniref:hypothetical protein n=1 Tax=Paracoccus sp. SM22M-07 TaxID=1520813 RepID=UPI000916A4F0|nr:hypothetical protein [Paracoccus sp. SM22M-07]OJH44221.1 hypothetical protein IE00_12170 [Paracoccus sp. SM22M-07]
MNDHLKRRTLMLGVGAVLMARQAHSEPSTDIRVILAFEGGNQIPKGSIDITLEDPAMADKTALQDMTWRVTSTGKDRKIAVPVPVSSPAARTGSGTAQIVARMTRADGWLLARGSARFQADQPIEITLHQVMY